MQTSRFALGALALAVSFTLSGCSLVQALSAPTTPLSASPTSEAQSPDSGEGYVYVDDTVGYAITFPGEPSVDPIAGNDNGAVRATYSTTAVPADPDGVYYIAGGTTGIPDEIDQEALEGMLFRLLNGAATDLSYDPVELDGVPGYLGHLTWNDGKPSSVAAIGEGHTYFVLTVIGGTQEQHQEFFDSFELRD